MEQQFSLSWNNFHGNLTNGFAGLLGKGEFVDVTIAVEGHLLQAHKVILSICSPYFKKMFQMTPCQHPIVVLRDVTHRAMRDLLQFMYHGEVSVKREDLNNFIGTAEVLQIKGLTNKETDEDDKERELEIPKDKLNHSNISGDVESCTSDTYDGSVNNDTTTNKLELQNQRQLRVSEQLVEKFQRISNLKRRSEEFLQKNYYSELMNTEKRPKLKEKPIYNKQNNILQGSNYENQRNSYDDNPVDIPMSFNSHQNSSNKNEELDKSIDSSSDNCLDLKTECEDSDIVVTDPAIHKNFEGQNDLPAVDYQSPQDNCTSLNSLFMDLKNLVNGKVSNLLRTNTNEEFLKHSTDHRLVTIPQKEDGKKKYPQRSCRLCWKIGKRRDTRFMCFACDLPFCKSPCFEIHFNDVLKISQFHGEYYAT